MANKIIPKRSSVSGKVPATTDLDVGEIAVNLTDRKIYTKDAGGTVVQLGGGAGSGDVVGPNSSTDNSIARFDLATGKLIQNSSATIDDSGNLTSLTHQATGTGANKMPVGTTAQRPATPETGMYRLNTTTGEPEWYNQATGQWVLFRNSPTYSVEYLVIAGGGGTANAYINNTGAKSGGGGAGGYLSGTLTVTPGQSYSATVGAGGAGNSGVDQGGNGGNSSLTGVATTAIGGGGSGRQSRAGASGGSGGGGGADGSAGGGSGTAGQGNAGGAGVDGSNGGGGGGAGGAGGTPAHGGSGLTWLDGVARAGGGAGAPAGSPGPGGGSPYTNGTANTGGGGGGVVGNTNGYNGGSGVVILRYVGAQRGSGGVVTSAGGYTYHTFNSSGVFTA